MRSRWLGLVALVVIVGGCSLDRTGIGAPRDASTDRRDPVDAAPRDDDGDGHATPLDCDDSDAEIHPGADERCNGADDDCDGSLGDACPWYFGTAAPVLDLHPTWAAVGQCRISDDGLRAYLVVGSTQVRVASRAAPNARWGAAQPVVFDITGSGLVIGGIAVMDDERELVFARGAALAYDLFTARRSALDAPFVEVGPILSLANGLALEAHPYGDARPLELWAAVYEAGVWTTRRAQRDAIELPWGAAERVAIEGEAGTDLTPFVTADRTRIFFARAIAPGVAPLQVAQRLGDGSYGGTAPVEPTATTSFELFPYVDEARGALYWASDRPWSPSPGHAIWRARLCREVPCEPEVVACREPGAVTSPDQRHCYFVPTPAVTSGAATQACESVGAHLLTIHSAAEAAVATAMITASGAPGGWTAGTAPADTSCTDAPACAFGWSTAEPFTWPTWRPGRPAPTDTRARCVMLTPAGELDDVGCEDLGVPVCEREI